MQRVGVRLKGREQKYEIVIGAGTLATLGDQARRSLGAGARRVAVISNRKVFGLYGERVMRSLCAQEFITAHWLMSDGERFKSLRTLEHALMFLTDFGLERNDAIVALGGGVVGDLAGLASALYLRGIALLQVPTTLLAQIDSSVGGKTAVNLRAGKNLVGAFHQPRAVIIDTETLRTLPPRELTAGWCEAVKQGATGSRKLFEQTRGFLHDLRASVPSDSTFQSEHLCQLIAAQCTFKASIVAGDEREELGRMDTRSRRILNFGHTTAHALEAITGYRRFRHGEAVGYGMLVAGEISKRLGMLGASELELLRMAVRQCGRLPRADDLDTTQIIAALAHDKKSVGGHIKWVLLKRIGRAEIVDGREIPAQILRASLRAALRHVT